MTLDAVELDAAELEHNTVVTNVAACALGTSAPRTVVAKIQRITSLPGHHRGYA
jgi:hypothetical protein